MFAHADISLSSGTERSAAEAELADPAGLAGSAAVWDEMVGKRNLNAREGTGRSAMPGPVRQHVRTEVSLSYCTGAYCNHQRMLVTEMAEPHRYMGAQPASAMAPKGEYMLVG